MISTYKLLLKQNNLQVDKTFVLSYYDVGNVELNRFVVDYVTNDGVAHYVTFVSLESAFDFIKSNFVL